MTSRGQLPALLIVIAFAALAGCKAAKILVVPNQSLSHTRYFAQVSVPLIELGHEVYGIMNGGCVKAVSTMTKAGIKVLPYYSEDRSCYTEQGNSLETSIFSEKGAVKMVDMLAIQSQNFLGDGEALFSNKTYFEELAKMKFDLCILDGFLLTIYNFIVPYKLDIPYAALTTSYFPQFAGVPALPSFTPVMMEPRSEQMSFNERLQNTLEFMFMPPFCLQLPGNRDLLVEKFAPEKPPISLVTLMKRSHLWLVNTDPVLDYPRVTLPHIISIGGLSVSPAKPLPDQLQTIMDNSQNGAVVISFGSLAKDIPKNIIDKVIAASKQFEHVTFVMRYNGPPIDNVPENIHLLQWLPQNDILGHSSTKLFITHSGNNGQFEALYHGVPMIAMPLFGDQPYNAKRMAVKGFGIAMDTFKFTTDDLVTNIREILSNGSYRMAISKASRIYRGQYHNARERAVYWIEHILEYGSSHLISHAVELDFHEYYLIDVFSAFIICIVMALTTFLVFVFGLLWCCYKRCIAKKPKDKLT